MNVYDPDFFGQVAHALADDLQTYLKQVQNPPHRTIDPLLPQEMLSRLRDLTSNRNGDVETRLRKIVNETLQYTRRMQSPNYMGHQVNPPIPVGGALQMIGGVLNASLAVYEMSQFGAAAERLMLKELCGRVGWGDSADGIVTSGGTLANITALLAARNVHFPESWDKGLQGKRPGVLTSAESHYSLVRSSGILGLGVDSVFKVPVDAKKRIRPDELARVKTQAEAQGFQIFCVMGSACTTALGAFDPLHEIGDFAKENGLWFHVDGAHGAPYLLSKKQRHLLNGVEKADSLTWDAHKMMFVSSLCTFLLYRDRKHSYAPFKQEAPYLFAAADDMRDYDGALRTFECTKGQLIYPVWALWALFGEELFENLLDRTSELTQEFARLLKASGDFTVVHEPQCNILCFRYMPEKLKGASPDEISEAQKRIRETLVGRGEYYITGAMVDGIYSLRVTLINPQTTSVHLKGLMDHIRDLF